MPAAENVGAISITGVASRRVTQTGALCMLLVGLIGKFGALFAAIPQALVAGMFTVSTEGAAPASPPCITLVLLMCLLAGHAEPPARRFSCCR